MTYRSGVSLSWHLDCKSSVAGNDGEQAGKKRKRGQSDSAPMLQLSLRPSHGAWQKATSAPAGAMSAPETLDIGRLKKGQQVLHQASLLCAQRLPKSHCGLFLLAIFSLSDSLLHSDDVVRNSL